MQALMYLESNGGNKEDRAAPCPGTNLRPVTRVAMARGHLDASSVGLCDQHKVPQPSIMWFVQRYTGSASLCSFFLPPPMKASMKLC